jgi:4-hydroxy-2-oxoheptanedioate aldolase
MRPAEEAGSSKGDEMPHERFATAWADDRAVLGGWVMTGSSAAVNLFAGAGFDYICVDTQHAPIDENAAAVLIQPLVASRTAALVRVSRNDAETIGKIADAGADGIIVPLVQSGAEAAAAVAACRYPPHGVRSMGPMRHEMGRDVAVLEDRVSVFVMVESREAVDDIEAICSTPGLTGIYVGPLDLAVSHGKAPFSAYYDPPDPELAAIIAHVGQVARRHGKVAGVHAGTVAMARHWIERGFRFISLGADVQLLAEGAARDLELARAIEPAAAA